MHIRPTQTIQTSQPINLQTRNTTERAAVGLPVDQLEISAEARLLGTQTVSGARADRIADIRAQIAEGRYETADKLELAVSRMFEELA